MPSRPQGRKRPARCAVCRRVSLRVVWREAGYEGRACVCGTVYVDPEPPEDAVDLTDEMHPESFYALPARHKAAWVAAHCPPGRLLEVGCGTGHFLSAARTLGYQVHGLEPHPERAHQVRISSGIDVTCDFIETADLEPSSFDVVYHCDLLSHFPDPQWALRAMKALLRPGGVLCFEVGLLGGLSSGWYQLIGSVGFPQHRWLYTESSLVRLLTTSGLEVRHQQHYGLAPYVLVGDACRAGRKLLRPPLRLLSGPAGARMRWRALEAGEQAQARLEHYFRYDIGRYAPRPGPQTLLVVAAPT